MIGRKVRIQKEKPDLRSVDSEFPIRDRDIWSSEKEQFVDIVYTFRVIGHVQVLGRDYTLRWKEQVELIDKTITEPERGGNQ